MEDKRTALSGKDFVGYISMSVNMWKEDQKQFSKNQSRLACYGRGDLIIDEVSDESGIDYYTSFQMQVLSIFSGSIQGTI